MSIATEPLRTEGLPSPSVRPRALVVADPRDSAPQRPLDAVRAVADARLQRMAGLANRLDVLAREVESADSPAAHALDTALDLAAACTEVRSFLDAVEAAAFAVAIDAYEGEHLADLDRRRPDLTPSRRRQEAAGARAAAADEISAATGAPRRGVDQRVALAHEATSSAGEPGRGWAAFSALVDGRATLRQAVDLVQSTDGLPAEQVEQIVATCLAPTGTVVLMADGSTVSVPVPQAAFRRRLRRQTAKYRGAQADSAQRARTALDERRLGLEPLPDGVAALSITGPTERVAAAARHVDVLARGLRAGGDERTLAQLRADVALDLLGGHPSNAAGNAAPPQVSVGVTVSLETLLGASGEPGEIAAIPGVHADSLTIPAHRVRELALAAGGLWTRIVTDPIDGTALDATTRYRPSAAMARVVVARDNGCRAPGCSESSSAAPDLGGTPGRDLDHVAPHERTRDTSIGNLQDLHRRCHNHKTHEHWAAEVDKTDPGAIRWRLPSGRTYTTHPNPYDRPDPHDAATPVHESFGPDESPAPTSAPRDLFDSSLRDVESANSLVPQPMPSDRARRIGPGEPPY